MTGLSNIKTIVETRLKSLVVKKDRELPDLIYDLGYDQDNEIVDSLFSHWTDTQKSIKNQIVRLGHHGNFSIFWVRLNNDKLNKTAQRTVINLINRRFPYNLVIFSNLNDTIWDFVNIKAVKNEPSDDDKEPKKRQYLRRIRIDQQERLRTAVERISLLKVPEAGIHHFELQKLHDEAFDVEKVTDAFFDDFKEVFSGFKNHLLELTNDDEWAHAFGLQFFNRLIFVYFIQKKRWLGENPEFVKSYWEAYQKAKQQKNSFAEKWLNVLFFDAFNKKAFYRKEWLPEKFDNILKNAPFLNGGLFKKTDLDNRYTVEIHDSEFKKLFDFLQSYNFTITEDSPIDQEVAVDPEMIGKIFETMTFVEGDVEKAHSHGIVYTPRTEITLMCRLVLVDRFANEFGIDHKNVFYELLFALTEEEKFDADKRISEQNLWPAIGDFLDRITILDPAVGSGSFLVGMLNVLADLKMRANSQLGVQDTIYRVKKNIVGRSLYGVDIMDWAVHVCELRLWLQLVVETDLKTEERTIEPLLPNLDLNIRAGDSLVQMVGDVNFSHLHLTSLPAAIRGKLTTLKGEKRKYFYNDPNRKYKSRKMVDNAELTIFREILNQQIHDRKEELKRIDRIIIGTDIEQKGLFGDEPKQETLKLKRANVQEKQRLQDELLQFQTARNTLKDRENIPFVWDISFAEIFGEDKHGFDIVIGNPPYVQHELIADPKKTPDDFGGETAVTWKTAKKAYKEKLMQSVYAAYPDFFRFDIHSKKAKRKLDAKNDLYIYFYLHGMSLLNPKGSFCFVTSNSWLDVGYGKDLQEFLLKKAPIRLIMDNQVKRSFRSADVNTVICLFGSPYIHPVIARSVTMKPAFRSSNAGRQSPSTAKFVMFYVPFEECLDAILFEEIDEATGRKTTPEYRVVEKERSELLEAGTDQAKKISIVSYTGDKWGGKYLRAPDIFFKIYHQLVKTGSSLIDYCEFSGYIHDNNTGTNFPSALVIKSSQLIRKINIYKIDGAENFGIKKSGNSRIVPDLVIPRTYGDTFIVYNNPDKILFKRFYKLIFKNTLETSCLLLILNSTFLILFWEYIGVPAGLGALNVYKNDFNKILVPYIDKTKFNKNIFFEFKNRIINNIWEECGIDKAQPIRSQEPNPLPDRKALDDIVFDAIGLTVDERKEVYWAVCELVQRRLEKAKSV